MKNRIRYVIGVIFCILLFLIYRLYNLQIIDNEDMLKRVSLQRLISVPVKNMRGTIFDRNLIPLTDNDEKIVLIVIPQLIENSGNAALIISKYCDKNFNEVYEDINNNKPFEYIINTENGKLIKENLTKGIIIARTSSRYGDNSVARHVLGHVNLDYIGQSGIEKSYDEYLVTSSRQRIGVISDAIRRPLLGYGYRAVETNEKNDLQNVKLTLDCHFQRIIENEFDKNSYDGAAVLLNTKTGDILSIVSRPNYDQNNVAKYFNSSNNELINKSLYPYNLGSIFKIIVAYAALEEKIIDEHTMFECPGFIIVDGQLKKCSSYYGGGHGQINLKEAFAKSCNTVFIELGLKLGHNKIIETANKFGLGSYVGLSKHGLIENPGNVKTKKYVSRRETANISIGQGEILATPIQIANMINIIANNGVNKKINIVDSIVDEDGFVIKQVREENEKRALSKESIKIVKDLMQAVATIGTGKSANSYEYGGISGKTSSAETGIYNNEEQIIHAWFGGFFPSNNPQYTLALIIEDGKSGSKTAAPLFGKISKAILKISK